MEESVGRAEEEVRGMLKEKMSPTLGWWSKLLPLLGGRGEGERRSDTQGDVSTWSREGGGRGCSGVGRVVGRVAGGGKGEGGGRGEGGGWWEGCSAEHRGVCSAIYRGG